MLDVDSSFSIFESAMIFNFASKVTITLGLFAFLPDRTKLATDATVKEKSSVYCYKQ
jgi:hypothetical protein